MSKAAELAALIGSQTALSNRNLIINGAMQVAQRATEVTGVTDSGYKAVDRWQNQTGSLGTFTMSQSTTAPDGFAFSQKYDCTTADASPASTDYLIFQHRIEAQNLQHLQYGTSGAKRITLSFHVRSNKTGTYIAELSHGDATSKNQQSYTINSANTWEKKTLSYVGQTSDAINNDNGIGMYIQFWLGSGSDFSSGTLTQNTWANTTTANRAVGQVNLADSTDNEWYITGVQLEVGEQATPFEHRSFGDELARCQRYYWENGGLDYTMHGAGMNLNTTTSDIALHLPVTMRSSPTVTSNALGIQSGATTYAVSSISNIKANTNVLYLRATVSGVTAGYGAVLVNNNNASGYLRYDAEL